MRERVYHKECCIKNLDQEGFHFRVSPGEFSMNEGYRILCEGTKEDIFPLVYPDYLTSY